MSIRSILGKITGFFVLKFFGVRSEEVETNEGIDEYLQIYASKFTKGFKWNEMARHHYKFHFVFDRSSKRIGGFVVHSSRDLIRTFTLAPQTVASLPQFAGPLTEICMLWKERGVPPGQSMALALSSALVAAEHGNRVLACASEYKVFQNITTILSDVAYEGPSEALKSNLWVISSTPKKMYENVINNLAQELRRRVFSRKPVYPPYRACN
jgi:hypothetical protein